MCKTKLVVSLLVVCWLAMSLPAATKVWDNESGDGSWHTALNWDTNTVPTSGDFVAIFTDGLADPTITTSFDLTPAGTIACYGGIADFRGAIMNSGTVDVNILYVGWGQFDRKGFFTQNNGTFNADTIAIAEVNSTGALTLNGGTIACDQFWVGRDGVADVNIDGGTLNIRNQFLLNSNSSTANVNIGTATLTLNSGMIDMVTGLSATPSQFDIANDDKATLTVNGGTIQVGDHLPFRVGNGSGITGTLNVNGGLVYVNQPSTASQAGHVKVGQSGGNGTINVSDSGVLTMNLSESSTSPEFQGGRSGYSQINVTDGGTFNINGLTGNVEMTFAQAGQSEITIGNGGSINVSKLNAFVLARNGGTSLLTINDGGLLSLSESQLVAALNNAADYSEIVIHSGGTLRNSNATGWTKVGANGGTGVVTLYPGAVFDMSEAAQEFQLGQDLDATGILNINGGTVEQDRVLSIGVNGTGVVDINGGALIAGATAHLPKQGIGSADVTIRNGGYMFVDAEFNISTRGTVTIDGGTLELDDYNDTEINAWITAGRIVVNSSYYAVEDSLVYTYDPNFASSITPTGELQPYEYDPCVIITWTAGINADSHEIYFSSNFEDVNSRSVTPTIKAVGDETYQVNGPFEFGEGPYYFAIDEISATHAGSPWRGSVREIDFDDSGTIDNFGSYEDTDDLNTKWTASYVMVVLELEEGYSNDPLMKVVLSPSDSYSEATFTDLDTEDINMISYNANVLQFRYGYAYDTDGDANVTSLYVAMTDSGNDTAKVTVTTDPVILSHQGDPRTINVALSDFDINNLDLTDVQKLTFGVTYDGSVSGGIDDAFLIDEIRRYSTVCDDAHLPDGDFTGDCDIDYDDLNVLAAEWLETVPGTITAVTPANSPILYYTFNEGTGEIAADTAGADANTYDLTLGSPSWDISDAYDGNCIQFNNNFIAELADDTNNPWKRFGSQITISLWINGTAASQPDVIDEGQGNDRTDDVVLIGLDDNNRQIFRFNAPWSDGVVMWLRDIGTSDDYVRWYDAVPQDYEGQWNHYAMTMDLDTGYMAIYHNGLLVARREYDDNPDSYDIPFSVCETFRVGGRTTANQLYSGKVDELRIYNVALSQAEILSLAGVASVNQDTLPPSDGSGFQSANSYTAVEDSTVNFKDFAVMAGDNWLGEDLEWPQP